MEAFRRLEEHLWRETVLNAGDVDSIPFLKNAAREAAAIAWSTAFPLLFYPELLQEKTAQAQKQLKKQREIAERSQWIVSMAV